MSLGAWLGPSDTPVKICGLTRAEDALLAQSLGARALGLIFYPKSSRAITAAAARAIADALGPDRTAALVGVFVNRSPRDVRRVADAVGLDAVQLHGDEAPAAYQSFDGLPFTKALRVRERSDLRAIARWPHARAILIDAASAGVYGGTGTLAPWHLAREARELLAPGQALVLAGGLTPDNAAAAAQQVEPDGLDLASGVESAPGVKDPRRLRSLFAVVGSQARGGPWERRGGRRGA